MCCAFYKNFRFVQICLHMNLEHSFTKSRTLMFTAPSRHQFRGSLSQVSRKENSCLRNESWICSHSTFQLTTLTTKRRSQFRLDRLTGVEVFSSTFFVVYQQRAVLLLYDLMLMSPQALRTHLQVRLGC